MMTTPSSHATRASLSVVGRSVVAALAFLLFGAGAAADEAPVGAPLRVAVYNVPPFGSVEPDDR